MKVKKKQRKKFSADPPNLARFRSSILHLTEQHKDSRQSDERPAVQSEATVQHGRKSRKFKRKEARKQKKILRDAFHRRTLMSNRNSVSTDDQNEEKQKQKNTCDDKFNKAEKEKKNPQKKTSRNDQKQQATDTRKRALLEANVHEDRLIKKIEKELKMNKRKSKQLPGSFLADGLDFVLDVVDSEKVNMLYGEDNDSAKDNEFAHADESDSDGEQFGLKLIDPSDDDNNDKDSDVIGQSDDDNDDKDSVVIGQSDDDNDDKDSDVIGQSDDENDDKDFDVIGQSDDENDDKDSDVIGQSDDENDDKDSDLMGQSDDDNQSDVVNQSSDDDEVEEEAASLGCSKAAAKPKQQQKPHLAHEDKTSAEHKTEESENAQLDKKRKTSDENERSDADNSDERGDSAEGKLNADTAALGIKEDIYGRLRDQEGNIVKSSAYIPPAKRLCADSNDDKKKQQLSRIRAQLKGWLNRLSTANIQSISNDIEAVYRNHSRADVTEILRDLVLQACIQQILVPERLIMDHAGLVALLHNNVGSEIGADFLQTLTKRWRHLQKESTAIESKELNNIQVFLASLYGFKVVHSLLVFDLLKELANKFEEKDIELILVFLKSVGFMLRKDDAGALKDVILLIHQRASGVNTSSFTDPSRVKFMLEIINAVKSNNLRRIPNYDPAPMEQLIKLLRSYCRAGKFGEHQLRISLTDLLNAEHQGRWWLVGSAWSGRTDAPKTDDSVICEVMTDVSDKVAQLAQKQRMNTDIRKAIFSSLITSEDFVDAFKKLLQLGLKSTQERELIHVTVNCCLQEKTFNPFYALVVQKFCEYHRRFQMSLQCQVWDKFKSLSELSEAQRLNLARLLLHLLSTHAISLSVFKVLDWGDLSKHHVRLLKYILTDLLLKYQDTLVLEIFGRITNLPKLEHLREGLRLFMKHFLLRGKHVNNDLKNSVERIERTLLASHGKLRM